jgi:cold shock protein
VTRLFGPRWTVLSYFGLDTRWYWRVPFPNMSCLVLAASVCPHKAALLHASAKERPVSRISGTVKFFNGAKGFGFVAPADGSKDVFVHASALELAGIHSLNEGDKISFVLEDDRKGRGKQAGQIQKE